MAKTKASVVEKIDTSEQANLVLKEIGLLERQLEEIDAEAHKQINKIKEEAEKKGLLARAAIAKDHSLISAYAKGNKKSLFKDARSVKLTFGSFGFRKSTSISIKDTTLALLKKLKMDGFILVKETPNKEALATLADKELAKVDAARKEKENFFCEPDMEEVNKMILKEQKAKKK
jgi:phage host-nuclease inhibitor protein Gam